MFGRRSHQRFTISPSPQGTLRILRDVLLERTAGGEIVVIGRHAGVVGARLKIEVAGAANPSVVVQVVESRPVVSEGTVRHRLTLLPADPANGFARATDDPATGKDSVGVLAVLSREVPVHVLNSSSSGCLLESAGPIELGDIASLRLTVGGQELSDDVKVVRCQAIEGSSTYHIGAEFLWTAPPKPLSLRMGIGQMSGSPGLTARASDQAEHL